MRYIIIDLSTGQRLHESLHKDRALKFLIASKEKSNTALFIAKANGHILAKVA